MLVSLIQSNYLDFGSGVTVPGWGINLQSRGTYFSLDSDHVNVIAPSKRTMHTLMPAMAFRNGKPWIVFGTEGGDGQGQTHVQVFTRLIDDGLELHTAMDRPRWEVAVDDWSVSAESRFDDDLLAELSKRGHRVKRAPAWTHGFSNGIEVMDFGYAAATDRRIDGAALGL
jgi:gamma-glutamyltranspeptidase/glutathione hydrolase